MEILIGVLCFLVGGGAGFGVAQIGKKKEEPIVVKEVVAEKQQDVVLQLTDLDLVKEACSSKFIVEQKQGKLLCRELFCRMQQRGVDAKTGATECETISNVMNKKAIYEFCESVSSYDSAENIEGADLAEEEEIFWKMPGTMVNTKTLKQCIEFFDRRI